MRIAVIGLGVQGRKRRVIAGDQVVAVIDPVAPGVDFQRVEDLPLASYDAACVCVPDQEKFAVLRYLLSNGKHALVEKPLLGSSAEIRELIEFSRAKGAACYTAYNHRFEPHIVKLKQILNSGSLGQIYLGKFFYGNGTARDVRNSPWRDKDLGVFSDLGSHMLDMAHFLFGPNDQLGELWSVDRFENKAPDHVLFGYRGQRVLEMEGTLLSWRNTFHLDLFGELGSAHIDGLCKWGPSTLTVRKRVLPSGRPEESVEVLEQSDPTWQLEYHHFLEVCRAAGTNLENDIWVSEKIRQLGEVISNIRS